MNVNAAEPEIKALITSRARKDYEFAGAKTIPVEIIHGTKPKIEEVEKMRRRKRMRRKRKRRSDHSPRMILGWIK